MDISLPTYVLKTKMVPVLEGLDAKVVWQHFLSTTLHYNVSWQYISKHLLLLKVMWLVIWHEWITWYRYARIRRNVVWTHLRGTLRDMNAIVFKNGSAADGAHPYEDNTVRCLIHCCFQHLKCHTVLSSYVWPQSLAELFFAFSHATASCHYSDHFTVYVQLYTDSKLVNI